MPEAYIRPYHRAADLRLMQDALIRGFDHTETRIGDLAWRARSHTHYELSLEISLWLEGSTLIGWTWLRTKGGFDLYVIPERRDQERIWLQMLDEIDRTVVARQQAGDELQEIYTWFGDEVDSVGPLLRARGFHQSDEPGGDVLRAELSDIRGPHLPDGYRLGYVLDDVDVDGRVELHRAAFAPSELTVASYRRVRGTWPYRAELDRVVKTASGQIVAGATAWLDVENRAGLLEPVAAHPDHQNLGLGRAVVTDALSALRAAGARIAQVGTSGPAARATYAAAGFTAWKQEQTFRKSLGD